MGDLYEVLNALSDTNGRKLLTTIIQVEGSAYRKEGTLMLILENGDRVGQLSGGCLEADLAERAPLVWEEGTSRTVVYDLRAEDDLSWGQGNGCNGTIHVLIEPVHAELMEHLQRVRDMLDDGIPLLHIKKLSDRRSVSDYLFYDGKDRWFGHWNGELPQGLDGLFANRKTGLKQLDHSLDWIFTQAIEPKPRLMIFGAGFDAKPLVSFAARAGFCVVVTDWRPALCNNVHFPEAQELLLGLPGEIAADFPFSKRDSAVVMTHYFQKDQQIIQALMSKELQYIGILGSKARTERLFGGRVPSRFQSPAGLSIGAEGPEEIAISILAGVIQSARQRRGKDDFGNLSGSRPKHENGAPQAVFAF
ncbi:XdhC family protein [Paenibacillus alkaliterrae]|uniref:XdhC family protein n=1 Tax=Paenibacillus alkaliterrae TaxID=320909 RepID=UPI001F2B098C|nr:XdhC family protein [Paenibacillus alkaliterrae]MCF2941667.1 XdhC family protein [Paenibacillus alkaliterrae]